ncbi:hypothetical protein SRHO_G00313480 [Serrasalmus rhombeus]
MVPARSLKKHSATLINKLQWAVVTVRESRQTAWSFLSVSFFTEMSTNVEMILKCHFENAPKASDGRQEKFQG